MQNHEENWECLNVAESCASNIKGNDYCQTVSFQIQQVIYFKLIGKAFPEGI